MSINLIFQSRRDSIHQTKFIPPPSSDQVVIIPLTDGHLFDRNAFYPDLIDNKLSMDEIDLFLKDFEKIIAKYKIYDNMLEYIRAGVAIFLIGFVIAVFVTRNHIGLSMLVAYLIFLAILAIVAVLTVKINQKRNENITNAKLEGDMLLQGKYIFMISRGLRGHLPAHFPRYIEIWKDYVGDGSKLDSKSLMRALSGKMEIKSSLFSQDVTGQMHQGYQTF